MWIDPIIQEIRAGRDAHAASLGYDAERIYAEIKQHEQVAKLQGLKFVTLQPRPVRVLPACAENAS
jgi:hypothetical protein